MADVLETLAGPAASLISSGLSYFGSKGLMKKQQEYNERNMRLQFMYGQQAQRQSYANMLSGMLAGGLNPAFDGSSPVAGAMPASSNPSVSFDAKEMNLLQGFQLSSLSEQVTNQKLQNKKQKMENRLLELDVENAEEKNRVFNERDSQTNADGSTTSSSDGIKLDVFPIRKGGFGRYEAENTLGEYNAVTHERNYRVAHADYQEALSRAMNSPEVIRSIKSMPEQELREIKERIEKIGLEKTYQDLLNQYQKMSNEEFGLTKISQVLANFKDDNMSMGEKLFSFLAYVLTFVGRH